MRRRLLWVGDAGVSSGFARATHQICDRLSAEFEVHVLGLNYRGDPHTFAYPIYPCWPGGDLFGLGRVRELANKLGPSVIVIQNDPWNFGAYLSRTGNVPVIGAVAVDGKLCQGTQLNKLALAVFWTEFAEKEARLGGFVGESAVVPLGVDLDVYHPIENPRHEMQLDRVLPSRGLPVDTFIVGVVGRNQPRKRLDLTLQYFAEWVQTRQIPDAALWLHVAPTGDQAFDLSALGEYYRIANRLIVPDIEMIHGLPEATMAKVYNVFDCLLTTTAGEGFGLPMFEAAACGVPVVAPDWSALGELLKDAALLVPCPTTSVAPNITTVGGVPDKQATIEALDLLYRDREARRLWAERARARAQEDRFRWDTVARGFQAAIERGLRR